VNNAAKNMSMQISIQDSDPFAYILRSEIVGPHSNSIFNVLMNFHMFSKVAAPFYIPTNSVQGLQFLHILTSTWYFLFFG